MSGKTQAKPRIGHCRHCGEEGRIEARGLDRPCYDRLTLSGDIVDYARSRRTQSEFVDDYLTLRRRGLTDPDIARELNYRRNSITKLKQRARERGYAI